MKTDHVQDLFQNKYRIPSARLQNWNYANPGMYFVTICTQNRENQFGSQSKNLASILRGYKSAVTTYARKNNIPFVWQPHFHDHIIRSDDAFNRISNYIVNNPANWKKDKFYTK